MFTEPFTDTPEARNAKKKGEEEHKRVESEIRSGQIPQSLKYAGLTLPIYPEKSSRFPITPDLVLSGRIDMQSQDLTVEIKTHNRIRGRDLMQAVLERMVGGSTTEKAAVYLPNNRTTYLIKDGGSSAEPELITVAINTRKILDNFERIDEIEKHEKNLVELIHFLIWKPL